MKLIKVKILEEIILDGLDITWKIGDIVEITQKDADHLVKNGAAEYIESVIEINEEAQELNESEDKSPESDETPLVTKPEQQVEAPPTTKIFEDYGFEIRPVKKGNYVIMDKENQAIWSFKNFGGPTQKTISEKTNVPLEVVEIAIARLLVKLDEEPEPETSFSSTAQPQISKDAIKVPKPGDGKYWEQIQENGKPYYVFYRPPNEIKKEEAWSYDHVHRIIDEDREIVYHPMVPIPWPLSGEPKEPGESLYDNIKAYIYDHVDLPDKRLYDVVAAWVLLTWIPEMTHVTPYLRFLGTKNVGKTRALEVLQHLCYRGTLSPSVSEAALFRLLEGYHITYLLDETEIYSTEQKQAIQNVLNAGYRRGQSVFRVEATPAGEQIVTGFQVFGPKALAGTKVLNETLESRCIQIVMEKASRKISFTLDMPRAKDIRRRLLLWRFRRLHYLDQAYSSEGSEGSEVSEGYTEAPEELRTIPNSRIVELFAPLLNIVVDTNNGQNITSYALDTYKDTSEEDSTGMEAQIINSIVIACNYLEPGAMGQWKFSTNKVAEAFNVDKHEKETWRTTSIGKVIKRLGFKPKRMTGGHAGWVYDREKIEKLCVTYSLEGSLSPSLTSLPSLPSLDESFKKAEEKEHSLHNDLKMLIRCLDEVDKESGGAAHIDQFWGLVNLKYKWTRETFDKVLGVAMKDGAIYSPRPGFYRVT